MLIVLVLTLIHGALCIDTQPRVAPLGYCMVLLFTMGRMAVVAVSRDIMSRHIQLAKVLKHGTRSDGMPIAEESRTM